MLLTPGMDFGAALAAALGLPRGGWQRIAIVADVDDVPRVYVRGIVMTPAVASIVQAVKDVQVSDECEVAVLPLAEEVPGV